MISVDLIESCKATVGDPIQETVGDPIQEEDLWTVCDSQSVWYAYSYSSKHGIDFSVSFAELVQKIVTLKRKCQSPRTSPISGRWIKFFPYFSAFDGFISELTDGFFDVSDCPPPEFWVGIENECLYAFVPEKFVGIADLGVRSSAMDCLEWIDDHDLPGRCSLTS